MSGLSETDLRNLYAWIDEIPLSRPKRNIHRDFADGVLVAEVVAHYLPGAVELHNFSAANSVAQKKYNWETLNTRVFRKITQMGGGGGGSGGGHWQVEAEDIDAIVRAQPFAIERLLFQLQEKIAWVKNRQKERDQSRVMQEEKQQRGGDRRRQGGEDDAGDDYDDVDDPDADDYVDENNDEERYDDRGDRRGSRQQQQQQQRRRGEPAGRGQGQRGGRVTGRGSPDRGGRRGNAPQQPQRGAISPASRRQKKRQNDQQQGGGAGGGDNADSLLAEKDRTIQELQETVEILELKVAKLEQLIRIKDARIARMVEQEAFAKYEVEPAS